MHCANWSNVYTGALYKLKQSYNLHTETNFYKSFYNQRGIM